MSNNANLRHSNHNSHNSHCKNGNKEYIDHAFLQGSCREWHFCIEGVIIDEFTSSIHIKNNMNISKRIQIKRPIVILLGKWWIMCKPEYENDKKYAYM